MYKTAAPLRLAGAFLVIGCVLVACDVAAAQTSTHGFVTGRGVEAWEKWETATLAILEHGKEFEEEIEAAFGELLALDPSPLRIALLADHTVNRTAAGGAVLLFEQDLEADALGPNGQKIAELLLTGREQMNQADDGWYFCQVGRFDVAGANFRALLAADPDPVALLEFTDSVPRRRDVLVQLSDNPSVGESVRGILTLLDRGELAVKADPTRIRENLARLGGPPRAFENGSAALQDSGEYAIPFIVQYLRDVRQRELIKPILRCLPQIDRPALNPLVMALRMSDPVVKRYLIEVAGKIGYAQSVPYLLQLYEDKRTPEELIPVIRAALQAIAQHGTTIAPQQSAAQAFLALAEGYYADKPSLAADVRLDSANVWYWRDDLLQNVEAPTPIFNEIMCLRCCEEALRLDPELKPALALWLAANFRREAQLPLAESDPTRPDEYPSAAYFAQAAGAEYCLMALARAVDDGDPAVALGAIDALRKTAGPASLVTDAEGRLPLAEALSFPDRMVRIRAALTLGHARPVQPFHNHPNLMPVLAEALMLHGGASNALVVDPDASSANAVAAVLRDQGFAALLDVGLYSGLQKVREDLPGVDVIFLASDIAEPDLTQALTALRGEFQFAATPVVIIAKRGDTERVRDLAQADYRLGQVLVNARPAQIAKAIAQVMHAVGAETITPEIGAILALEAAQVLRLLAVTDNALFDVSAAEAALLIALDSDDLELRLEVAEVLGYLGSVKAQDAIAGIALDDAEPEDTRVKMFQALAAAAKRRGALLGHESIERIVKVAEGDANMVIREAASETLGALSVSGKPASTIIRNQYQG